MAIEHEAQEAAQAEAEHAQEALSRLNQLLWAGLLFALAGFAQFPKADLLVSSAWYKAGQGFVLAKHPVVLALYDWTPLIGRSLLACLAVYAMLAPLLARWQASKGRIGVAKRLMGPWRHTATLSVCCAFLGPGLLVEGVFKNMVGRPRPVQVVQFGGQNNYLPPFKMGNAPESHRSFVSSHAATGFWLITWGLSCGPVWRRRWLLIGLGAGATIGAGRILQGGHYLSDVIFAFYSVWLSALLIEWLDRKWFHPQP